MKKLVTMMSVAVLLLVSGFVLTACGSNGKNGTDGTHGKSAYEIWLDNGHTGDESAFLEWLKGAAGKDGKDGQDLTAHTHDFSAWTVFLQPTEENDGYEMRTCATCGNMGIQISATAGLEFGLRSGSTTEYEVTGYKGTSLDAIIPAKYKGLPVTAIGTSAFWDNSSLTSVTIPASVIDIWNSAFSGCANLTNVIFDKNSLLETIRQEAFWGCKKLASIVIPASVTGIYSTAFGSCTALTTVFYGGTNVTAWDAITGSGKPAATLVKYYSATEITGGTHWRYVNDIPTIWA